jgi:hypothetical protein
MVKQLDSLDLSAESGTYEVDRFAKRFEPDDDYERPPRAKFETLTRELRVGVNRMVRLARHRAEREDNPARTSAMKLQADLKVVERRLAPWLARDPGVTAAQLMPAFAGGESPATALVQLVEWGRYIRSIPIAPPSASASAPLARHLTALAIKLHRDRLGEMPPQTRDHWLAEFLAAIREDFQLPIKEGRGAGAIGYWGRKIQEHLAKSKP